jgi:hypothetical protein
MSGQILRTTLPGSDVPPLPINFNTDVVSFPAHTAKFDFTLIIVPLALVEIMLVCLYFELLYYFITLLL